jgi:hypothetical protein
MSSYENTCPKCGDSYKTEGWEPVKCPFCELAEYQRTERLKLAERNGLLEENARLRKGADLGLRHHLSSALDLLWVEYGNGYGTEKEKLISEIQVEVDKLSEERV